MDRPWLLDLFAGAGGAGEGYRRAGFHVVSVDIAPQPHNPHEFYQADALVVLDTLLAHEEWQGYRLHDFQAIHASPPCQGYSQTLRQSGRSASDYPRLIASMRARLAPSGVPWIMENVTGAPMGHFLILCGTHFGLPIYRHRQFEASHYLFSPGRCAHPRALLPGYMTIYGNMRAGGHPAGTDGRGKRHLYTLEDARRAMGIDWMTQRELSQAIPPAYTQWIGQQVMAVVAGRAA